MSAGQIDEAIQQLHLTTELTPDFSEAHRSLAVAYAKQRKFDEALAEARKAMELNPSNVGARATLGYVYAVSGDRKEAAKVLQQLRADTANDSLLFEAWIETGLGETDQAIASLEKEYAARTPMMVAISLEPIFEPLRSNARFVDLLRRIQTGE